MDFQLNNFNSISSYNKVFEQNLNKVNSELGAEKEFEAIFNKAQEQMANSSNNPSNSINGGVEMVVGADAISSQKVENLSDSAKMMQDFSSSFSNGINSLNDRQKEANNAVETLASGGDISIHEVMIASQKSSLAMQMAIQVRNQMLNAYNEFKNIRI